MIAIKIRFCFSDLVATFDIIRDDTGLCVCLWVIPENNIIVFVLVSVGLDSASIRSYRSGYDTVPGRSHDDCSAYLAISDHKNEHKPTRSASTKVLSLSLSLTLSLSFSLSVSSSRYPCVRLIAMKLRRGGGVRKATDSSQRYNSQMSTYLVVCNSFWFSLDPSHLPQSLPTFNGMLKWHNQNYWDKTKSLGAKLTVVSSILSFKSSSFFKLHTYSYKRINTRFHILY